MSAAGPRIEVPVEWWRDFFHGLALEMWRAAVPEDVTRQEASALERLFGLEPGARLLDVPCGNGRLSLELAARGHRLSGLDIAPDFVEEARAAARARGLDVDFRCGEMRELPAGPFDGVFCWGNSFGYLDDAGNRAFLVAARTSLRSGGRLVLDVPSLAESIFSQVEPERTLQVGDITFGARQEYDPRSARLNSVYSFEKDGRIQEGLASHRIYTGRELIGLLEDAGFEVEALHGDAEGAPLRIGPGRPVAVARAR